MASARKTAKTEAEKPRGRGRPRAEVDPYQVEMLARMGCTQDEIGQVVRCSADTLARNFADSIKKGQAHLKTALRKMQYKSASKGNVSMLIWLGKQYLGQRNEPIPTKSDRLAELLREFRARNTRNVAQYGPDDGDVGNGDDVDS